MKKLTANQKTGTARVTYRVTKVSTELAEFCREIGTQSAVYNLSQWVAAHYIATASQIADDSGEAGLPLDVLHRLTSDVSVLRRGDHNAIRLENEQRWIAIERDKTHERQEALFEKWAEEPENRLRFQESTIHNDPILRQVLGYPPLDPNEMQKQPTPGATSLSDL